MSPHKIYKTLFAATVLVSVVFLTYSASAYFDAYAFARDISVKVQKFSILPQDSNVTVETTLMLRNPTKLELKVSYIKQEIFRYSNYKGLLGESYSSSWHLPSGEYVAKVSPFSNGTVTMKILITDFPSGSSNIRLFSAVHMRIEDIPIIGALYLTRYFTLAS